MENEIQLFLVEIKKVNLRIKEYSKKSNYSKIKRN